METTFSAVDHTALWARYRETHDPAARRELIEDYLPLVKKVVRGLHLTLPPTMDVDDLISNGTVGLINAVERFHPERQVKFSTYAPSRIRGTIIDQLRADDWVPRSTRHQAQEIRRGCDELQQSLDRNPTEAEIAGHLKLSSNQYKRAVAAQASVTFSLDQVLHLDDAVETTVSDLLEDPTAPNPLQVAEQAELSEALSRAIDTLPERDRKVIRLHYQEEKSLKETGRSLGISESRASQLRERAIYRLREKLLPFRGPDGPARRPTPFTSPMKPAA